ncbi:MAG: dipeptide epimerase [Chitinophagales bacterium]|nr:dipeptide epimerase [Chitinophagales bacterium]MDW8418457.1 dipeptide epimerase [Chitinophagales bacterium]
MKISVYPYRLVFRHPFAIAYGMRSHTDVVYVKIQHREHTGWGEAALPPYLRETPESVRQFLEAHIPAMERMCSIAEAAEYLKHIYPVNYPAVAALDMALWHLRMLTGERIEEHTAGLPRRKPLNTYTIGISDERTMQQKIADALAYGFRLFKIKLNGKDDELQIKTFRRFTELPFGADANQAWQDISEASDKAAWLREAGCIWIEQPFAAQRDAELAALLKSKNILPVFADESCHTLADLQKINEAYDGVNIKLMKCGGITPAIEMIREARAMNLQILLGCMSESTVGCRAAALLAVYADYTDLDGPYLIENDCFTGVAMHEGSVEAGDLVQHSNTL